MLTICADNKSDIEIIDQELIKDWIESLPDIETAAGGKYAWGNEIHEIPELLIEFKWEVYPTLEQHRIYILAVWVGPDEDPEQIELSQVQAKEIESAIADRLF